MMAKTLLRSFAFLAFFFGISCHDILPTLLKQGSSNFKQCPIFSKYFAHSIDVAV